MKYHDRNFRTTGNIMAAP
jgi:hypothetical protein